MYFLKNLFLYSGARFKQTKCVVMMTKKGSTKIVNFMTSGSGVLVLAMAWSYKLYSEINALFL